MLKAWTVIENDEHGTCVHVTIDEATKLDNLMFSLLDMNRQPIVTMKVATHEIYICTNVDDPMFIKLGDDVEYLKGSGKKFYNKSKDEPSKKKTT